MKKHFYLPLVFAGLLALVWACDNGNADIKLFDSPPSIVVVKPLKYTSNVDFNLKAVFKDGADPSLSKSPLATASFKITNPTFVTTVQEGPLTVSGVVTEVTRPITALPVGQYKLIVNVSDQNGNTKKDTTTFEVISTVGIIGSATPGGWDASTAMTRSATDSDVYSITVNLVAGEAKFRANNAWVVSWGAAKFPTAVGDVGGANIPVTAGRYLVTFNISTGAYSFVPAS